MEFQLSPKQRSSDSDIKLSMFRSMAIVFHPYTRSRISQWISVKGTARQVAYLEISVRLSTFN